MQFALCYVSTASPTLPNSEILDLLQQSSRNNDFKKITGILLYSNGNFFQVLEGPKDLVLELYQKIEEDKRHYNLMLIFKKEVPGSKFSTYENAFLSLDAAYNSDDLEYYTAQVEKLDPTIQNSVKYILQNFS
jgi:hypothetical protein